MSFVDHFPRNSSLLLHHAEGGIVCEWVCIMHFLNSFAKLVSMLVVPLLDHILRVFELVSLGVGVGEKVVRQQGKVEDGGCRSAETCGFVWGVYYCGQR
jgi:hypothetical protein